MRFAALILFILVCNIGCRKQEDPVDIAGQKLPANFADTVREDRYYPQDIIETSNSKLYGNWRIYRVLGISTIIQNIIFKRNGIYCLTSGENTLEYGQLMLLSQNNTELVLWFNPDNANKTTFLPGHYSMLIQGTDSFQLASVFGMEDSRYWIAKIK